MGSKFRLALIQLSVGANKSENLVRASNKIAEAVEKGANIVSLPGKITNDYVDVTLHHLFPTRVFQLSLWDPVLQRLRRGCS